MARQLEQCVGELISMCNGRQLGDRCKNKSYKLWNHLCSHHVDQHDNPRYPTRNSYLRRSDERPAPNVSQMEARLNMLQTGASTPVITSSRATASAEPSQSSIPQRQPTPSNPQPQIPPEQPDRRRPATPEPPGRIPLHSPTPIQASNAGMGLRSHNLTTPPATETRTPPEQSDHQRHATPEPSRRMSLQITAPTQASNAIRTLPSHTLATHPASVRRLSTGDIHASYNQSPNPATTAIKSSIPRRSVRTQNQTIEANNPPLTSTPRRNHNPYTASSNSEDSDSNSNQSEDEISLYTPPNHAHTPRPPSSTPENQARAGSQVSRSASLRTHISVSTNTPTLIPTLSTVSRNVDYYNGLTPPLSPASHYRQSRLRTITIHLYHLLHDLQLAGFCPNAEPLGPDWIEPSSVPDGDPNPTHTIFDIIVDVLWTHMEFRDLDIDEVGVLDGMATALLRTGCKESRSGEKFREGLRRWSEVHGEGEGGE